ncbi:uncharacterized protein LOC126259655 [Schistocerca nitens]|uniref:uncharacterized protein LOC126232560 n=1 Tax=Schistocerca nitens TaxID=7011 RepID=UPI0021180BE3|nr:uncharacterized protein LOC126232560 [Schistocerca nitens]XP_049812543.1 uncharacterized protein LOC126259655 [Schistocerca nitens]
MSSKNNKVCDPDNICSEHLKTTFPVLVIPLTALLNECLKRGIVPDQWKYSKIFTTLLCKRLRDILDEKLPDSQFGFRCGRSVAQAVHCLQTDTKMAVANRGGKLHAIFVDFTKAFDTINRSILMKKLETSLGPRHYLLPVIRDLHYFFYRLLKP